VIVSLLRILRWIGVSFLLMLQRQRARETIIEPLISRIPINIQFIPPLLQGQSTQVNADKQLFADIGVLHYQSIRLIRFADHPYGFYEKPYNSLLDEAKLLSNCI
jgi:hypothetical protein